jgi:preprotein translocase subunit SecE
MAFQANANSESKSKWARYANPVNWFKGIWKFLVECRNELRRITWPDRSKVFRSTGVVISSVVAITLFVWLVDSLFGQGLNYFLSVLK